jgi:hypothetical protein
VIKYQKTKSDEAREKTDLAHNPIMRFMKNQTLFRFKVGDYLVKHVRVRHRSEDSWQVEAVAGNGAPKKFVYVFENELGIGYIKQLRVNGAGFTKQIQCMANFDPNQAYFTLDPDYADHLLIGQGDFQYNAAYLANKKYRQDAIASNTKLLINTRTLASCAEWFHSLKVGDTFWYGTTWEELIGEQLSVTAIADNPKRLMPSYVLDNLRKCGAPALLPSYRVIELSRITRGYIMVTVDHFIGHKVMTQKPFPLKDTLCGRQR